MKEGDVLLTIIPQDISEKLRPVLFLRKMPSYNDLLVCAISTQLQHFINDFDLIIEASSPEFKISGLIRPSIIRLGSLAVIPQIAIAGSIGKISQSSLNQLKNNLAKYLLNKNE